MEVRPRELFAACVAIAALSVGALAYGQPALDTGLRLEQQGENIVVSAVAPGSEAWLEGIEPGMYVQYSDAGFYYDAPAGSRPPSIDAAQSSSILGLGAAVDGSGYMYWLGEMDWARQRSKYAVVAGLLLLAAGWSFLRRRGGTLRPFAASLPVAVAAPLLLAPLERTAALPALALAALLLPLTQAPLALDLALELPAGRPRHAVWSLVVLLAAAAAIAGFFLPIEMWSRTMRILLVAAISFVPSALVAREWRLTRAAGGDAGPSGRVAGAASVVAAGITPAVVLVPFVGRGEILVWPVFVWLAAIAVARYVTLGPLLRLASRATLQRDVAVGAAEAERARIAADIHDEVLQDMTMLVRRLDARGDPENAEAAREIAGRLRAICGELRLPILDDLGVGPALDWLVERQDGVVEGQIFLERLEDEPRMPAPVELALFRIAQEALTNAVRHGRPPIVVRYRSGGTWAELDVDDAGTGVPAGAAERAEQAGHYGLLNMAQRAEQIGAEFRIARRPGGGTRVSVVWESTGADAVPAAPSLGTGAMRQAR